MPKLARLSEFGQEMRLAPGLEFNIGVVEHDGLPPHWHISELRQMHARVVRCRCGFWTPLDAAYCPACQRKRGRPT